jgi:hypothetical protein
MMKRAIRVALFLLGGLALPAAFVHAFSSWAGEAGWDPRLTGEQFVQESQRQQKLESNTPIVAQCLAQKHQVINEVLAGRLTLAEAARHFHECEAWRDERLGKPIPLLDSSRAAAMARTVLKWAGAFVTESREGHGRLRALQKEYQVKFNGVAVSGLIPG